MRPVTGGHPQACVCGDLELGVCFWSVSSPVGLCLSLSSEDEWEGALPCPCDVGEEHIRAAGMGAMECCGLPKSKATSILQGLCVCDVEHTQQKKPSLTQNSLGGTFDLCSRTLLYDT